MSATTLLTQSLVSRLIRSETTPLSAREYWALARAVPVDQLSGLSVEEIGDRFGVEPSIADRIPPLLGRSRALALAVEELEHKGFWVISASDESYPVRLRDRLGDAAPALLYGVGDRALLELDGIGVVGSRNVGPESVAVTDGVAAFAHEHELPIVSGGARGIDQQAMNASFRLGGAAVGALADSLVRTSAEPSVRRAITEGRIALITPYSPTAPFSAGNAMGRNKLIYALSRATLVVRSDLGSGGTWAGATEALSKGFGTVWSWLGEGSGPGNHPLVEKGATGVEKLADLAPLLATAPRPQARPDGDPSVAVTLF